MRDVRVLCRWPQWQSYREQLLASGKINETKLQEIETTTELDSLDLVELIMSFEEAFDVKFVERPEQPVSPSTRT
jgi:hypothetical protein